MGEKFFAQNQKRRFCRNLFLSSQLIPGDSNFISPLQVKCHLIVMPRGTSPDILGSYFPRMRAERKKRECGFCGGTGHDRRNCVIVGVAGIGGGGGSDAGDGGGDDLFDEGGFDDMELDSQSVAGSFGASAGAGLAFAARKRGRVVCGEGGGGEGVGVVGVGSGGGGAAASPTAISTDTGGGSSLSGTARWRKRRLDSLGGVPAMGSAIRLSSLPLPMVRAVREFIYVYDLVFDEEGDAWAGGAEVTRGAAFSKQSRPAHATMPQAITAAAKSAYANSQAQARAAAEDADAYAYADVAASRALALVLEKDAVAAAAASTSLVDAEAVVEVSVPIQIENGDQDTYNDGEEEEEYFDGMWDDVNDNNDEDDSDEQGEDSIDVDEVDNGDNGESEGGGGGEGEGEGDSAPPQTKRERR